MPRRTAAPVAAVLAALGVAGGLRAQVPNAAAEPLPEEGASVLAPMQQYRLRAIRVETQDIFRPAETGARVVPRLLNAAHSRTRTETVMREVFVRPGDLVDESHAEELARNLRALGIFAEVEAKLVPTSRAGEADLVVRTRDRLTLAVGGGVSYVGGTTGFNASAAESNLLGKGDRIAASFRNNHQGDFRGVGSWQDLHLFDTWARSNLRLSRTDDGDGVGLTVDRPFKHLRDPLSWRGSVSYDELAQEYYALGEEAAAVGYDRSAAEAEIGRLSGERFARSGFGVQVRFQDLDYEDSSSLRERGFFVPSDTRTLASALTFRGSWVEGFRTATAIDTLGFVQDIALSTEVDIAAGAVLRYEDGTSSEVQPTLDAHAGATWEPVARWLIGVSAEAAGRWGRDALVGWRLAGRVQMVRMWNEAHVLCLSSRYDAAVEEQDLPVQFTMGADSGLRGYDARLLSGSRRLSASAEERWDTGVELWAFRIGLAAFSDIGWITDDEELGSAYVGVGGGLRIGSAPLLGNSVMRLDLAKPLDDAEGNTGGIELSFTVGQSFTFGGSSRLSPLR